MHLFLRDKVRLITVKEEVAWWNAELQSEQKKLKLIRRKIFRVRTDEQKQSLREEYNNLPTGTDSIRRFLTQNRPWGKPYKIMVKGTTKTA